MACFNPKGMRDDAGKALYRPCGACLGCRLDYARDWAVRCHHEAQMHEENSFITMTYNEKNMPEGETLVKEDFRRFIKDLREELYPKKIRFFGCGEYGKKNKRPHYHCCVFGFDFPDKEIFKGRKWQGNRFKKGSNNIYRSAGLEKLWDKGFSTIGEVSYESAGYVARYVTKKIKGEKAKEHYKGRLPEFAAMSRMPGIGAKWFEKYETDVYPKDFVTINGKRFKPPRYYDELLKKRNVFKWWQMKEKRKEERERRPYEHHLRNWQKEYHKIQQTKVLKRGLE